MDRVRRIIVDYVRVRRLRTKVGYFISLKFKEMIIEYTYVQPTWSNLASVAWRGARRVAGPGRTEGCKRYGHTLKQDYYELDLAYLLHNGHILQYPQNYNRYDRLKIWSREPNFVITLRW